MPELPVAILAPLLILGCFACGSIPFSLLVGLAKGVDIRTIGSGNPGATNLGRALGRRWFFVGFALDALKGFVPVLVAGWLLGGLGVWNPPWDIALVWLACVFAAVLGHVFTPWLKFKGGKGVATAFGALLGVFPLLTWAGLGVLAVYLVLLGAFRYVSLGSVVGAASLPVWTALLLLRHGQWEFGALGRGSAPIFLGVTALLALLVILKHRANIARLRRGTEPKIGTRVGATAQHASSSATEVRSPHRST